MSLVDTSSNADTKPARDDSAKFRQILDGARTVFLADGFDGASMSDIARAAGVSKGTLYVYFASKEDLFAALIREEKRQQAEQTCRFDSSSSDVAQTLQTLGERLLDRMFQPTSMAHLRTVAAVAAKFPSIGQAFYEAGPLHGQQRLSSYLAAQAEAGIIAIDDPLFAATMFIEMCKAVYFLPVLLCVAESPSPDTIRRHITSVTTAFLRAYPLLTAGR